MIVVQLTSGTYSIGAHGYMARIFKNGELIGGLSDYNFEAMPREELRWELLVWLRRNGYCRDGY